MDQRKIELNWFLDEAKAEGISRQEVFSAIGYLAQWAIAGETYTTARITIQEDGEMLAVYTNQDNTLKFVMGAVWHGDHYGFHS
jgi:hypothetical protein